MKVNPKKIIREAIKKHPNRASAIEGWQKVMENNDFVSSSEIKNVFGAFQKVGDRYVFDIGGNNLRLIAKIFFKLKRINVLYILTHTEYDKNNWRN